MYKARRSAVWPALTIMLVFSILLPASAAAQEGVEDGRWDRDQRRELRQYAADTWQSFVMMVEPATGLPADNVSADGVRAKYTSPTNIGAYLWSTLAARDLGIINQREAFDRISKTLATLATLERHAPSGQFYNWYDPATGAKLTQWQVDGNQIFPFLSTVDNGWLVAALIMVGNGMPRLRNEARTIVEAMNFGFYYDPNVGLLRGGYWPAPPPGQDGCGGFTCFHYGTLNTEPRIASYIGIAMGDVPPTHYYKMWRTFPDTCDWSWQEMQPQGVTRNYMGVDVFQGHYTYRGINLVPSWGGSMFEALMVPLLVPEEQWAPRSWGVNHPLYVRAQIEHGLEDARYGYWGFSPSNNPAGGYREYGVDLIGMNPDGYASDQQRTTSDIGFGDCPGREPKPLPTTYGEGVVTPHASFLALEFAPDAALENLAKLRQNFDAYGSGGFYDAVNVTTGEVSKCYLALDQGMIMPAIANALRRDRLQRYFTQGEIEQVIRPLIEIEEFTAGD
jgi:hypothetical protein